RVERSWRDLVRRLLERRQQGELVYVHHPGHCFGECQRTVVWLPESSGDALSRSVSGGRCARARPPADLGRKAYAPPAACDSVSSPVEDKRSGAPKRRKTRPNQPMFFEGHGRLRLHGSPLFAQRDRFASIEPVANPAKNSSRGRQRGACWSADSLEGDGFATRQWRTLTMISKAASPISRREP